MVSTIIFSLIGVAFAWVVTCILELKKEIASLQHSLNCYKREIELMKESLPIW